MSMETLSPYFLLSQPYISMIILSSSSSGFTLPGRGLGGVAAPLQTNCRLYPLRLLAGGFQFSKTMLWPRGVIRTAPSLSTPMKISSSSRSGSVPLGHSSPLGASLTPPAGYHAQTCGSGTLRPPRMSGKYEQT